ncbi:hypothetical protein KIH87_02680 [Paraneptunicella aestuarii]|uniref:hypothetical protein n=1 Tax=Paraneptunicella aestuarii TaxID=2831148 RepID=UPI001E3C18D6|nr:hypothetical protein [Paraneptunicella aestuarii]UAA39289.1 hypothetical protein KIH87_02680 [Paraneptunicella aestuarii]
MKINMKYVLFGAVLSVSSFSYAYSQCCLQLCAKFSGSPTDYQECLRTCVDTGGFCYLM